MRELIDRLPKAELHVHIEGTLEPDLMFALAEANGYELPFAGIEAVKEAYQFTDLQSFLDIYYQGAAVLQTPDDFYRLMTEYLDRAAADGVRRAEIFFDPQSHTERGVGFEVFMEGFRGAMDDAAARNGVSSDLIMCFLRHLSGEEAVETLHEAEPHLERVIGVGLDSSEKGRHPELFKDAYEGAARLGLRRVAHAGEEGPPEYVTAALDILGAERIDHGVRSLEDADLVDRLRASGVPLTVCPLSNVALQVVGDISEHPIRQMIESGLTVSVNSDDPAYFGGYIGDNYEALAKGLAFTIGELADIARMSIESSFLTDVAKKQLVAEVDEVTAPGRGKLPPA